LQSTLAALARGSTCFITNDRADAVLDTSRAWLEHDITPHLGDRLTLLSFGKFFVNKVRSRRTVDAPLAEVGRLLAERRARHVVFDTLDPFLTWADASEAPATTRTIVSVMNGWGVPVLCTLRAASAATPELARVASATIELRDQEIVLRHASWCSARDQRARRRLVQGRGMMVSAEDDPADEDTDSDIDGFDEPHTIPWTSLIVDARSLLGFDEEEYETLARDLFSTETLQE
jgi:hypothetical protein